MPLRQQPYKLSVCDQRGRFSLGTHDDPQAVLCPFGARRCDRLSIRSNNSSDSANNRRPSSVRLTPHRSGIHSESDALLAVGRALQNGGVRLGGVLAHAGSSCEDDDHETLRTIAEQERHGAVRAAERLREAGLPCAVVSVGSTPTALTASGLHGVTEARAGVYVFFDLAMRNVGVCTLHDIALSVLTTVIGHQDEKGWAITDAGWMAMSRDRGTQNQKSAMGWCVPSMVSRLPIADCRPHLQECQSGTRDLAHQWQ